MVLNGAESDFCWMNALGQRWAEKFRALLVTVRWLPTVAFDISGICDML